jgi:hypothetical protein
MPPCEAIASGEPAGTLECWPSHWTVSPTSAARCQLLLPPSLALERPLRRDGAASCISFSTSEAVIRAERAAPACPSLFSRPPRCICGRVWAQSGRQGRPAASAVTPQTTARPARAAAQRVSVGSDGVWPASDDGWAWPNQRRSRPNAGGQPSYGRRGRHGWRAPCRWLARAVDAGACRRPWSVRRGQAPCLALWPPYDVCSRLRGLAGARSPLPPQQRAQPAPCARGSGTSWQEPRPQTESAPNCPFSTF